LLKFIIVSLLFFTVCLSAKVSELSKQPQILSIGNIIYPESLKSLKKEGDVKVFIDIDKNGKMKMFGVYTSTDKDFEKAFSKGIKQIKFSPAEYKNKPVSIRIKYTYKFNLKGDVNKTITDVLPNKFYKTEKEIIDSGKEVDKTEEEKKEETENITVVETETVVEEKDENIHQIDKENLTEEEKNLDMVNKKIDGLAETIEKSKENQEEVPVLSKMPELIKFVEAEYPEELRKTKTEGNVVFAIDIDEDGKIINTVIISSTNELFNIPATNAIKQFEFTPGEYENKPVPVRITYQYNFIIKEEQQATKEEIEKAKEEKTVIVEKKDYDSIKGKVVSYGTREPVKNALVYAIDLQERSFETMTDENGNFLYRNLDDGIYIIVVPEKDHFLRYETREEIKKGELLNLKIYLPLDNLNPYELTVTSNKGKKEVTKEVIKVEELLKIPGTSGDAIKVIQNLPGVSRTGSFSGEIAIRGAKPMDNAIYVDGQFVPILFHFGGLTSVINSELLEDVSYYPGGYSVKYGRALGGTIDVKTRKIKTKNDTENIHGYYDIDLIDTSGMVEVPIDEQSGIAVAFRRSYIDFILPAILPDDFANTLVVLPVYYDGQVKYNNKLTSKDDISFMIFGSSDEMKLVFDKPEGDPNLVGDFSLSTAFVASNFVWEHKTSKTMNHYTSIAIQYDTFNVQLAEFFKISVYQVPITYRYNFEYKPFENLTINTGLDGAFAIYSGEVTAPNTQPDSNSGEFMPLGTYEQIHQELTDYLFMPAFYAEIMYEINNFKFIPGIRFDTDTTSKNFSFDARLATMYTINDKFLLKGSVGKYGQRPMDEYYFDEKFGNPDVYYQYMLQYTLGVEYQLTDYIKSSLEFFYYRGYDLVVTSTDKVSKDGEIVNENFNNDGQSRSYGMEVFIRHNMSAKFFGWISYTLMNAEVKDHPGDSWEYSKYDQRHILTILGSYKLPYGFEIGARLRYTTGSWETPIIGAIYDPDNSSYAPIYGEPNSQRSDPFFQLDLRIDKSWQYEWWTLTAYLDVQNATYYKNQEGTNYNYDYSESQKIEGLPIFPSFGVKGTF